MSILDEMIPRVKAAQRTIVLPEGQDFRVIQAAVKAASMGLCTPIVLGTPVEIAAAEEKAGVTLASQNIRVIDYTTSDLLPKLAASLNPNGVIAISGFADGNLPEIAEITGYSLPCPSPERFRDLFTPFFTITHFEAWITVLHFSAPRQVLEHLKLTGTTGISGKSRWTKGRLADFSARYIDRFSDGDGVTLTYRPLLLVGCKKGS